MAKRARKKRKRPEEEIVWYAVRIEDWNWDYHFGVNHDRRKPNAYTEYRTLEVEGQPFCPSSLKAESAIVHVMTDDGLLDAERKEGMTPSAGFVEVRDNLFQANLWLPSDVQPSLLQLLIAGKLRYAVMIGEKLRYRRARIRSFQFCCMLDEDEDLPDVR